MNRRNFIRTGILAGIGIQFPHLWIKNAGAQQNRFKITLLQTNDTHSRVDPFPMDGGRNQGMGGVARRATIINTIRAHNPNTLLVDAGDVLQGTPYFNLFKGKVEYQAMSRLKYDVSTIGNHEFDNGVHSLNDALSYANFDIVNCNYNFGASPLAKQVKTFLIRQMGPVRVGITGVGIDFADMVAPKNHEGISYIEPYEPLQSVVEYLRKDLNCSLIVVLSHLGYKYDDESPSDLLLAAKVKGIDWIVGGHTHTFMKAPDEIADKDGNITRILQVGFGGILLGRTDFFFEGKNLMAVKTKNMTIDSAVSNAFKTKELLA